MAKIEDFKAFNPSEQLLRSDLNTESKEWHGLKGALTRFYHFITRHYAFSNVLKSIEKLIRSDSSELEINKMSKEEIREVTKRLGVWISTQSEDSEYSRAINSTVTEIQQIWNKSHPNDKIE